MDFTVWLIILLIAAVVNVSGKTKKKRQEAAKHQPLNQPVNPAESFEEETQEAHESVMRSAKPSLQPMKPELTSMIDKRDFPPETKPKTAQPKVHVHTADPCPEDGGFQGSLNYESPEGQDSCHEEMLHPADGNHRSEPERHEDGGLHLDFSPNALVQAVVMQEILTRPCDRRRR